MPRGDPGRGRLPAFLPHGAGAPSLLRSPAAQYSGRMLGTQEELERALVPIARALTGATNGEVRTLLGGASNRRYHRIKLDRGEPGSLIVMELGDEPLKSEEVVKGADAAAELPFVNVLCYLERGDIAVPQLYRYERPTGLLFLEDLGDQTFESVVLQADIEMRRR